MPELDDNTLQALARRMLDDYDLVQPGTVFSEGLRLSIADAWRLQSAVATLREQRGEAVVGYKVGCVSKGNQKMMGLTHPVWGRLWSTELYQDGAVLRKSTFANLALEAEFAVTLGRTIDPERTSPEDLMTSIAAIYPVVELHNLVLHSDPPHGHELIASNGILAGIVSGHGTADPKTPTTTDLALIFDGETVDSWAELRWPDDILSSIGWLSQQQASLGRQLQKGDVILTGAFGPPIPLESKTTVDVTSSAFGQVRATFS